MSITYSWKVTGMRVIDADDLQNVVVHTKWTKKGIDEDGDEGSFDGATPLSQTTNTDDFIPFEELTEDIVIEWIQSELTDQVHIDYQIQRQIEMKKNPEIEKKLPWSIDNPL